MNNRIIKHSVVVCTGVFGTLFGHSVSAAPPKYKNVILILTDDMGYHLSALGTPGILPQTSTNYCKQEPFSAMHSQLVLPLLRAEVRFSRVCTRTPTDTGEILTRCL